MAPLFASGHIVDLILALTAVEFTILLIHYRRTRHGVAPVDLLFNLLAGIFLLLALRCGLRGAWWGWVGAWLFAALVAHVADLLRRWR
jgi:hypothetical protein